MLLAGGAAYYEMAGDPRTITERDRRLVDALAVTLYPGNPGPPGDQVGAADFVERYFREGLEPAVARVMRGVFVAIEWGALFSTGARFSALTPARRTRYLQAIERGGILALRSALFGLKSIVNLAYFDHPAVRQAVGLTRVCEVAG